MALLRWLGERDAQGVATLRRLLAGRPLIEVPMLAAEPSGLDELEALGRVVARRLGRR